MPQDVNQYFNDIARIWRDFFRGKIGEQQRENQLRRYRAILKDLPLSNFHR